MRKWLLAMSLTSAVFLAACSDKEPVEGSLEEEQQQNETASEQVEVVKEYIQILNLDEGTYEEFVKLHADPSTMMDAEQFEMHRIQKEASDVLPKEVESIEDVEKHLVAVLNDETHASVYWAENPKEDTLQDAKLVWQLVLVEDEWKIQ